MTWNASAVSDAVQNGDDQLVVQLVKAALAQGVPATGILDSGLVPGIQRLGALFQDGEVFLPEVLISCRAMDRGVDELKPFLAAGDMHKKGRILIGTVEGDLHDIGKNIVRLMLECGGFEVIDLGVDVPVASFVNAVRTNSPDILAMSALLTITMTNMPEVLSALEKAGLRDRVRVMIGGAPITREYADQIGAEGFAPDCASAVIEAERLVKA
ncbi:MAG: corrinoid protein [Dehalococcoidia bacterium]|jgi:5-methyltetrahydrofolate--homocysteine methyltransferase|nr:corrinoid protein [Dehalococcoidia bacterium]